MGFFSFGFNNIKFEVYLYDRIDCVVVEVCLVGIIIEYFMFFIFK